MIFKKKSGCLLLTAALFLCSCGDNTADNDEINTAEIISPICVHDENYIEPTLKTGKYYLNGDINSYFWNVTEDTIELCGVDLGELNDSWQSWGNDPASDGSDDDVVQKRIKAKEDWVKKWSGAHSYSVETRHEIDDKVWILMVETVAIDGMIMKNGLILKDENTITGFGKDGDFILVE